MHLMLGFLLFCACLYVVARIWRLLLAFTLGALAILFTGVFLMSFNPTALLFLGIIGLIASFWWSREHDGDSWVRVRQGTALFDKQIANGQKPTEPPPDPREARARWRSFKRCQRELWTT